MMIASDVMRRFDGQVVSSESGDWSMHVTPRDPKAEDGHYTFDCRFENGSESFSNEITVANPSLAADQVKKALAVFVDRGDRKTPWRISTTGIV